LRSSVSARSRQMRTAETGSDNAEYSEKDFSRAKNMAYRALALRPRSAKEVAERLHDRGCADAVIDAVLAALGRYGYLNDEVFAGQWVEGRVRLRSFGRRRIERELADKGVDGETARSSLERHLPADRERETARQAALRKLATLRGFDRIVRRRRLAGFLERKGFSFALIRDIIRELDEGRAEQSADPGEL